MHLTPREVKSLEEMSWGEFFFLLTKMVGMTVALIVTSMFLQVYITPYACHYFAQFN